MKCRESNSFGTKRHLYDTDNGVVKVEDLENEWDDDEEF